MSLQTIPSREAFRESYVDAVEAAKFIGASDKTVLRMARTGKLPAHPIGEGLKRRHWRFLISELDGWMRARNNAGVHQRRPEGGNSL
jgi:excisionase family DNA binding protein